MQQRVVKSCPLHVPSTLPACPAPSALVPPSRSSSPRPVRTSFSPLADAFFLAPSNAFYSILFFFSFQMVQAIQVLRFHLLELEKVSIFHVSLRRCLAQRYRRWPTDRARARARCRAICCSPVLLDRVSFASFI
jgi:hypothetical protein